MKGENIMTIPEKEPEEKTADYLMKLIRLGGIAMADGDIITAYSYLEKIEALAKEAILNDGDRVKFKDGSEYTSRTFMRDFFSGKNIVG